MKNYKYRKRSGFIGVEVAIVASIVLLTGFAALNAFNARATNTKDDLIGQFQNSQLNLNGAGSVLTDDQIDQLKQAVLESINIDAIKTSVLNLLNVAEIRQDLLDSISVSQIEADILTAINVPQIKADILTTINVPQLTSDIIAAINVPQITADIMAAFPTDADTLDSLHSTSFVRSDNENGFTPNTAILLTAGNNLNSITTPGFYYQNTNANATTANNYPVNNVAGTLMVQKTTTGGVVQTFTLYNTGDVYTRVYNASWSAWGELFSSSNDGAGSGLNADLLDSYDSAALAALSENEIVAGQWTFNGIPAFNGGTSGSTAPFTVDSTTVVTNLNSDMLDGLHASDFAQASLIYDDSATYRQILAKDGSATGYVRAPSNGFIPSANGTGGLGTSSWRWASVYANAYYQGSGLEPVVSIAGHETTNPYTIKYSSGWIQKYGTFSSAGTLAMSAYGTGGLYMSALQTYTFDTTYPFTIIPSVTVTQSASSIARSFVIVSSVTTTGFTYYVVQNSSSSASWSFVFNAIGR